MEKVTKRGTRAFLISGVCVTAIVFVGTLVIGINDAMIFFANIMIALSVFGTLALVMTGFQGWKTFGRRTIYGLPRLLFVFYAIVFSLAGMLFIFSIQMDPQKNVMSLSLAFMTGLIGSLFAWYFGVNEWVASRREDDARLEFKKRGYTPEKIEWRIKRLKELKVI